MFLALGLCLAAPRPAVFFGLANPLENVGEAEIDLPALHVHLHDLHPDAVAQAVDAAGVLAAQHVRAARTPGGSTGWATA